MNVALKEEDKMSDAAFGEFVARHIGPSSVETEEMLTYLGHSSLQDFISAVVPQNIRSHAAFSLTDFPAEQSEQAVLKRLAGIAANNKVFRSFIGMGYYGTHTPGVIQRNILENPGWYTQYTPYQPEISQGRLEALLNYQTLVCDLTGMAVANASLLDEGTAAAEAMVLCKTQTEGQRNSFFVADDCHPQTIAVVKTRAEALGVNLIVKSPLSFQADPDLFGALLQYPNTFGEIADYKSIIDQLHAGGALAVVASDLLALCLLKPPGEFGADVVVGSAQRFGVPFGYGGPHAAFMAVRDEYKRSMPGRLVGVSKDSNGQPALRLSLQTREQHIRRERATSNICTAQVLLAVMASMYAVYHGPRGLRRIAERVHGLTHSLVAALKAKSIKILNQNFFDTITLEVETTQLREILNRCFECELNLRIIDQKRLSISLDERTTLEDLQDLIYVISADKTECKNVNAQIAANFRRSSKYLTNPVFNSYHSETEFLRYMRRLESKDLSLATSMIPLGSCTMKLNATSEMLPVTWETFSNIHPFAPLPQCKGYQQLFKELEQALAQITGFKAVSLQPNAGSQGEYAGLLAIRAYLQSLGEAQRDLCLIPRSAHGTNPASAVMAGFKVMVVECDEKGNIDIQDLKQKALDNRDQLACLMATYPSTHGVFEAGIKEICQAIHENGGQVYMDGANLNALVGLVRPAELGADVCHINLHKTFCIPHGGGGPGMGPIAVAAHLAPFLPNHPVIELASSPAVGPVSAAPWGSASILTISWVYVALMASEGLKRATEMAILNANYIAKRLEQHYPVLYKGQNGLVAHECILDLRPLEKSSGVKVEDVAKRLMDYGFHAPTVSWPVAGTVMIEPTESESKQELDRFCDAMIMIRKEITQIEEGKLERENNMLKHAPHTAVVVTAAQWDRPYSREVAAFPAKWLKDYKFWPSVGRIDAAYGDKNLVCTCPDISSYS